MFAMLISQRNRFIRIVFLITLVICSSFLFKKEKPTLYIIGDSTVRNGDGTGKNGQWGWGSFLANYFDTTKITIENDAIGGRSSRTFITEGRWEKILARLKKGDYVLMQFGHNDASPLDDTARARGTIPGIGNESKEIYNPITKKQEVVYTYGWYMRKYVNETKAHKATAIVCSPVPRDNWENNKVKRADSTYGGWAKDIASANGVYFIDLNNRIAEQYETMGQSSVAKFFPADHTHTNYEGALISARIVKEELVKLKGNPLKKYFLKAKKSG